MGQVTVAINGRGYTVGCDQGQEDHVSELAAYLDHHISDLKDQMGEIGDARLMLLAGLMVADELSETVAKLEELEAEIDTLRAEKATAPAGMGSAEAQMAEAIGGIAARIEDIAVRLNTA